VPVALAQSTQPSGRDFRERPHFDGTSDRLSAPSNVLVVGTSSFDLDRGAHSRARKERPVTRIAGGRATLMPGLIDGHTHIMFETLTQEAGCSRPISLTSPSPPRQGRQRHADARLHQRPRPGRAAFGLKRGIDTGLGPVRASGHRAP